MYLSLRMGDLIAVNVLFLSCGHWQYIKNILELLEVDIIQEYMPCSVHLRICRKFIGQI